MCQKTFDNKIIYVNVKLMMKELSLFHLFRIAGHYNAEGYKLVVEAIGKRLEADGYVPIKSRK